MIEIVTDSSAMYTSEEAGKRGFHVVGLHIVCDAESFRDLEEADGIQMDQWCRQGRQVRSSQPSVGEKQELYDRLLQDPGTQVLDIAMADGLSGTFQSAQMAARLCSDPERVTVWNSRTLGGPQQYLVETAVAMRDADRSLQEILDRLEAIENTDVSTVTVPDMRFLARGGRIPEVLGSAGHLMKLMPTFVKKEDGTALEVLAMGRTWKKAFDAFDRKADIGPDSVLYILHGNDLPTAEKARVWFGSRHPGLDIRIRMCSAVFLVHGGPGCVALQAVKRVRTEAET